MENDPKRSEETIDFGTLHDGENRYTSRNGHITFVAQASGGHVQSLTALDPTGKEVVITGVTRLGAGFCLVCLGINFSGLPACFVTLCRFLPEKLRPN